MKKSGPLCQVGPTGGWQCRDRNLERIPAKFCTTVSCGVGGWANRVWALVEARGWAPGRSQGMALPPTSCVASGK